MNNLHEHTVGVVKATAVATYSASGSAFIFGMSANTFAAIASLVLALIFGLANLALSNHYKRKHFELAVRLNNAKIEE